MDYFDQLQERFPELERVSSPPSLFTMNGVGTMLHGSRDYDPATQTYVSTLTLTILFIPVINIAAYRVANAPNGGWYFLGKTPLSNFARRWNYFALVLPVLVGLGIFGAVQWDEHTKSPKYRAEQALAKGDKHLAQGKLSWAADAFVSAEAGLPGEVPGRMDAVANAPLDAADPEEVRQGWRRLGDYYRRDKMPDLPARTARRAQELADSRPAIAVVLIQSAREMAPRDAAIQDQQEKILQAVLVKTPDNLDAITDLAGILEARHDLDACAKLLEPHADKLGERESARILGQALVRQGKFEEAFKVLSPYTESRLAKYLQAEQNLRQAEDNLILPLQRGTAPDFDFKRFQRSPKDVQDQMIRDYLARQAKSDPAVAAAIDELNRTGTVVHAALDLGVALMRRAQGMNDPAQRQKELEKAEKTFLAVRGAAGKDNEFRLFLGQVYYWMGKQAEGQKLVDEALAANPDDFQTRFAAAQILREVGERGKAIQVLEESFAKAPDAKDRFHAARMRSILALEREDAAAWLAKCDPNDPDVRSELARHRGQIASLAGKDDEAIAEYKKAIEFLESLESRATAVSMNNTALIYLEMYRVTGDRADFDQAVKRMERAIALRPRDSVLVLNSADVLLTHSLTDVIGNAIDWKTLKTQGATEHLSFIFANQKDRQALVARLAKHPGIVQARNYYERAVLLAPNSYHGYLALANLYEALDDVPALADLLAKVQAAKIDRTGQKNLDDPAELNRIKKDLDDHLARGEKVIAAARKVGGPTFAVAASQVNRGQIGYETLFPEPRKNADAMCDLADEAHRLSPSSGTTNNLTSAYLHRAHGRLESADAAYRALMAPVRTKLPSTFLVAWALSQDGPHKKACDADPDVRKVREILRTRYAEFPQVVSEWGWAVCHGDAPDGGKSMLDQLKKNERHRLKNAIEDALSNSETVPVITRAWRLEAEGKADEAAAYFREQKDRGVALPEWSSK